MKPSLLAPLLCAVLAGPAWSAPAPKGGDKTSELPKFDFTIRPQLQPAPAVPEYDAAKPMKNEVAQVLSDHLFALYQNIGSLGRFLHHKRTKGEPPMPAEDLAWAQKELASAKAAADKAQPQAQAALKVGIERLPPYSEEMRRMIGKTGRLGRMMLHGRAKLAAPIPPSLEHWQIVENDAQAAVMCDLYYLVSMARDRLENVETKDVALTEKSLAENLSELAAARAKILAARQEAEERKALDDSKIDEARERVKRATKRMGGFGDGKDSSKDDKTPGAEPDGAPGGGGSSEADGLRSSSVLTPEAAALRASSVDRVPQKSLKSRTVPNP